jgi:hypothetical protein
METSFKCIDCPRQRKCIETNTERFWSGKPHHRKESELCEKVNDILGKPYDPDYNFDEYSETRLSRKTDKGNEPLTYFAYKLQEAITEFLTPEDGDPTFFVRDSYSNEPPETLSEFSRLILTDKENRVLYASIVEGKSQKKISEKEKVTTRTIRNWLKDAKNKDSRGCLGLSNDGAIEKGDLPPKESLGVYEPPPVLPYESCTTWPERGHGRQHPNGQYHLRPITSSPDPKADLRLTVNAIADDFWAYLKNHCFRTGSTTMVPVLVYQHVHPGSVIRERSVYQLPPNTVFPPGHRVYHETWHNDGELCATNEDGPPMKMENLVSFPQPIDTMFPMPDLTKVNAFAELTDPLPRWVKFRKMRTRRRKQLNQGLLPSEELKKTEELPRVQTTLTLRTAKPYSTQYWEQKFSNEPVTTNSAFAIRHEEQAKLFY